MSDDAPWTGNPEARMAYLERKVSAQRKRIKRLEADVEFAGSEGYRYAFANLTQSLWQMDLRKVAREMTIREVVELITALDAAYPGPLKVRCPECLRRESEH